GLFFIAVLVTSVPPILPTSAWQIGYFATAGVLFVFAGLLPLAAALTGGDVVWRLRPGRLTVERITPLRRHRLDLTGADIAAVTVE
ncbi:hypothetical protein J8J27_31060, partial [Mycobacterium tuberculosis]|nr:hypothetical protein [Mycobacterium tuberculosis]